MEIPGYVVPRVVFYGVQIPIEIKHTIAIQAVALPVSGKRLIQVVIGS